MYLGLQTTTAVNAVLLNSSAPLFMLLCSWMIEREAASARQLVGVLISLAGSRERSISSASPPYSPAWSWLRGRRASANSNAVKRAHVVILNDAAWSIVQSQKGIHGDWVFPYRGKPVRSMNNTAWQRARKEIGLLEANGVQWRVRPEPVPPASRPEPSRISTDEKVALFRRLFRGRADAYPIRWESKTTAESGYWPACANEWRAGVCEKPRIKCGDCSNRLLIPLSDAVLYDHLAGEHTVGVYPLLEDDTCYFLAIDFDEAEWREDARAFVQSCDELGVPVALEISRSGKGAHAWIFFAGRVSARDARRLGTAIISHTCAHWLPISTVAGKLPTNERNVASPLPTMR